MTKYNLETETTVHLKGMHLVAEPSGATPVGSDLQTISIDGDKFGTIDISGKPFLVVDTDYMICATNNAGNVSMGSCYSTIAVMVYNLIYSGIDIPGDIASNLYPGVTAFTTSLMDVNVTDTICSPISYFINDEGVYWGILSKDFAIKFYAMELASEGDGMYADVYAKLQSGEIPFPVRWRSDESQQFQVIFPILDNNAVGSLFDLYISAIMSPTYSARSLSLFGV